MVAHALDDRGRAGVAHAEPLADLAADVGLTARGAVERDVAGDDVVLGDERRVAVREQITRPPERPFAK